MKTYSTSEIAKISGVHSNTIRFYEEMELMPTVLRKENGYRIFTEQHVQQVKLIRLVFQSEILANNLRKQVLSIIKATAAEKYQEALLLTKDYEKNLELEKSHGEEAIEITQQLMAHSHSNLDEGVIKKRPVAAAYLGITKDVLREWERSGLIEVPRNNQGHRIYGMAEIQRAKIIRTLRMAHYSMMSILRMLNTLDQDSEADILTAIDTPNDEEDIILAADRFITTLTLAQADCKKMVAIIEKLAESYG